MQLPKRCEQNKYQNKYLSNQLYILINYGCLGGLPECKVDEGSKCFLRGYITVATVNTNIRRNIVLL